MCNDESVDEQSLWVRALGVCGERRESRASAVRALLVWTLELSSRTSRVNEGDVDGSVIRSAEVGCRLQRRIDLEIGYTQSVAAFRQGLGL